jgi:hypothetical protein
MGLALAHNPLLWLGELVFGCGPRRILGLILLISGVVLHKTREYKRIRYGDAHVGKVPLPTRAKCPYLREPRSRLHRSNLTTGALPSGRSIETNPAASK